MLSLLKAVPPEYNNPVERSRPMRVLALGMSRTGTQSMSKALSLLGYDRVYHGHDIGDSIKDVLLWRDLWQRKQQPSHVPSAIKSQDFDKILGHCEAVTDAPAALFWSELMDAYPDAKIVLVHRDTETWYQSFSSVCIDPFCSTRSHVVRWGVRFKIIPYNVLAFLPDLLMTYFRARTKREFQSHARAIYEEHNASIRARAESEGRQILHMTLEDGFEALCAFLDRPVPSVEFPRGNDGPTLRKRTFWGYTIVSTLVFLCLFGYCALLLLAVILWKRVY